MSCTLYLILYHIILYMPAYKDMCICNYVDYYVYLCVWLYLLCMCVFGFICLCVLVCVSVCVFISVLVCVLLLLAF